MGEFLVLSHQALLHLGDWKAQNLHRESFKKNKII